MMEKMSPNTGLMEAATNREGISRLYTSVMLASRPKFRIITAMMNAPPPNTPPQMEFFLPVEVDLPMSAR